jgi:FkbM family methyltransferase
LIAHWVVNKYDYLFSVDSDISFESNTLVKLLAHNKDVVCGLYIQRIPGTHTLEVYERNGQGGVSNIPVDKLPANSLYEISGCGFGCTLVKKEVMVAIGYPQFKYYSAIDHRHTISEDVDFCRKALEKGFRLWADTSIICGHTGKFTFNVDRNRMNGVPQSIQPLAPPTDPIQDRLRELRMMKLLPEGHVDYVRSIRDQMNFTPKVIYDIGACVLHWTDRIEEVWPEAEIILFEAVNHLEFMYKEKGLKYQMGALSDIDGKEVDFYQNDRDPGGSSYYRENVDFSPMAAKLFSDDHRKKLKTLTLSTAIANNGFPLPDLIKMDVQGAELDVLKGGLAALKNAKHVILELQHVEYNKGAPNCDIIINFMYEQGFDCKGIFYLNDTKFDGDYHFVNRAFLDK